MGIHPNDAKPAVFCRAANRTHRKTVISAEHERKATALNGCGNRSCDAPRHGKDAIDVFEFGIGNLACFLNGHFDVTYVIKGVSQLFQFLVKMSIPDRAGTHIHTAAVRTEINGHANNVYLHE
jgi:hypothetical protein